MPPEAAQDLAEEIDKQITEEAGAADGGANDDAPKQSSEEAVRVAKLVGWKDPKEWQGTPPPGGLKTAEEFLEDLPKVSQAQRKTIDRLSGQVTRIVAQVSRLDKVQQRQMDADLETELEAAIEAGDKEGAKKILARAKAAPEAAEPDKPEALADFEERNADWYNVDPEATDYVVFLDRKFAQEAGGADKIDPAAHMKKIEAGVKKRFPELFEAGDGKGGDDKGQRRAPLVARNRGGGDRQRGSGELTLADLTPAQRMAIKTMGVKPESYVKNFNLLNKAS